MRGYTQTEIEAALASLLPPTPVAETFTNGARNSAAQRLAAQDLVGSRFLLVPRSPYYLVQLARNLAEGIRQQLLGLCDRLTEGLQDLYAVPGNPIQDTTELSNARAAIIDMGGAVTPGVNNPGVHRFQTAVGRYLEQLRVTTISGSEVIGTTPEIRTDLSAAYTEFKTQRDALVLILDAIAGFQAALGSTQYSQTLVSGIVSRIQSRIQELQDQAQLPATHRLALLQLLTARSVLTRVVTPRAHETILLPAPNGSLTATPTAGTTPGYVQTAISGPWNWPESSVLNLSVETPEIPVALALPRYSNAEVRTADLSAGVTFVGAECAVYVDHSVVAETVALVGAFTPATLALALNTDLGFAAVAEAIVDGGQVIIRSLRYQNDSHIEVLATTSAQQEFVGLTGIGIHGFHRPIEPQELLVVTGATATVDAQELRTDYGTHSGTSVAGGGNERLLDLSLDSGADLVVSGTSVVAARQLQSLGVKAGMVLVITAPPAAAGQYVLTSVSGNTATTATAVPDPGGAATYYIGPDIDVVAIDGAQVVLGTTDIRNQGWYLVDSAAAGGRLILNRDIPVRPSTCSATIFTKYLRLQAASADPTDGIRVSATTVASTQMGLISTVAQVRGSATTITIAGADLLTADIKPGDILRLSTLATYVIQGINSATELELEAPGIPYSTGTLAAEICSKQGLAYEALVSETEAFVEQEPDLLEAVRLTLERVLNSARGSQGLTAVAAYKDNLELLDLTYTSGDPDTGIDEALRMLEDLGLDRARTVLLNLGLQEFFSMTPDAMSFSTHMARELSTNTRQLVPVGRKMQPLNQGENLGYQTTSFQPRVFGA